MALWQREEEDSLRFSSVLFSSLAYIICMGWVLPFMAVHSCCCCCRGKSFLPAPWPSGVLVNQLACATSSGPPWVFPCIVTFHILYWDVSYSLDPPCYISATFFLTYGFSLYNIFYHFLTSHPYEIKLTDISMKYLKHLISPLFSWKLS
jgi:hypothetical protein